MSVMKGREFPGFLNSQIFYGFMVRRADMQDISVYRAAGRLNMRWLGVQVQNVETWRPAVEVCRVQLVACLRGICTEVTASTLAPLCLTQFAPL
jgi:hypothetical protein